MFLCCRDEVEEQLAKMTNQKDQTEAALKDAERTLEGVTEDRSATLVTMLLVLMII